MPVLIKLGQTTVVLIPSFFKAYNSCLNKRICLELTNLQNFVFTLTIHVNQQLQILMNNNQHNLKHHIGRQHLQSLQYDHDYVRALMVKMLSVSKYEKIE
jgi:hypothetical protein